MKVDNVLIAQCQRKSGRLVHKGANLVQTYINYAWLHNRAMDGQEERESEFKREFEKAELELRKFVARL